MWQTIETAPQDGTEILVVSPPSRMAVVWWGDINGEDAGECDHHPHYCWLFYDGKNQPMHYRAWSWVTHWMALPEPPK